ncbi:MAG: phosphoribosylglycinamide formyltransferase, partial [Chloroflexi bacterium]|nr:phosphoribosylglycinamide formyltransferase [Chloroflexota bacterium]
MLRIGWFSTGRDEAARDLLKVVQDNTQRGEVDARIEFVFSNREPGESRESDLFFDLVRGFGIPLVCLSSAQFGKGKRAARGSGVWGHGAGPNPQPPT